MTVRELLQRIDSAELTEWFVFDKLEPFGDPRADLRNGILTAAVINYGFSRPETVVKPIDFMPFRPKHRPQDDEPLPNDSAVVEKLVFKGIKIERPMQLRRT
jgi:hypothetical protein